MREREKLEREADHRRQVFADSVRDGRRDARAYGATGWSDRHSRSRKSLSLRRLQEVIQRSPVVLASALGVLGFVGFFHTPEQKAHVG